MLLANRYDDRTHFIYELLQNAEDALAGREGRRESRAVSFDLNPHRLRVSHYGVPFGANDLAGLCGIGESTKDLNAIGRFGIGFKSVYAFSVRPEIHSGSEDFAIESYVWPVAAWDGESSKSLPGIDVFAVSEPMKIDLALISVRYIDEPIAANSISPSPWNSEVP